MWVIATDIGGQHIGSLTISREVGQPGEGHLIKGLFANVDGVWIVTSPAINDYDLYQYSHDLTERLNLWENFDVSQNAGAISIESGFFYVSGNTICTLGGFNNDQISVYQMFTLFNQSVIFPVGTTTTSLENSRLHGINIGADLFFLEERLMFVVNYLMEFLLLLIL